MKIAVLSRNSSLYSTKRLVESIKSRGHEAVVLDHLLCDLIIEASGPAVYYKGEKVEDLDAIIPRIGASVTFYGTAVVRQFEMTGSFCVNESVAISRSRDKLRSLQLLSRKGVGLPRTGFANKPDNTKDLIKNVGGAPLVIKLLEGTQGIGVVLADTNKAAESIAIYNNQGVLQFETSGKEIDLRDLNKGSYILKIKSQNGFFFQ